MQNLLTKLLYWQPLLPSFLRTVSADFGNKRVNKGCILMNFCSLLVSVSASEFLQRNVFSQVKCSHSTTEYVCVQCPVCTHVQ